MPEFSRCAHRFESGTLCTNLAVYRHELRGFLCGFCGAIHDKRGREIGRLPIEEHGYKASKTLSLARQAAANEYHRRAGLKPPHRGKGGNKSVLTRPPE